MRFVSFGVLFESLPSPLPYLCVLCWLLRSRAPALCRRGFPCSLLQSSSICSARALVDRRRCPPPTAPLPRLPPPCSPPAVRWCRPAMRCKSVSRPTDNRKLCDATTSSDCRRQQKTQENTRMLLDAVDGVRMYACFDPPPSSRCWSASSLLMIACGSSRLFACRLGIGRLYPRDMQPQVSESYAHMQ